MIKATSVHLMADSADVLAYLFQLDSTQWICLRSPSAAANRGWLECWSSKGESAPDMASALEAVRVIVADKLMHGPFGPYISGARFIPGWNTWEGGGPRADCAASPGRSRRKLRCSNRAGSVSEPTAVVRQRIVAGCVLYRGDEQGGVAFVEAGDGVTEADGGAACEAGGQQEDASFASGAGSSPACRAVMAASQSMAAIGVVPSVMLVPVSMNRLVKSSRCRNVPLPVSRATPASSG